MKTAEAVADDAGDCLLHWLAGYDDSDVRYKVILVQTSPDEGVCLRYESTDRDDPRRQVFEIHLHAIEVPQP